MAGPNRRSVLTGVGMAGASFALSPLAQAQPAAPSDTDVAIRLLERYHPGLLRYLHTAGWARATERFRSDYSASDLRGQYLALSRLTAAIRCSHSFVNPSNLDDAVAEQLWGSACLLPFNFTWLGERMIITADPHKRGLAAGSEVTKIDGKPVAAMLAELLPLTRADGSLDNKRRALLSVGSAQKLETFDMLSHALWPLGETVALEGSFGSRTLATISLAERRAAVPNGLPEDAATPWWRVERDGRDAVLTMPSWSMFSTKWPWKDWLNGTLDALADDGTRRLVIDLRGNEGGLSEVGSLILSRLSNRAIQPQPQRRVLRFERVAEEDRPFLSTWDKSFYSAGEGRAELAPGWRAVPAGSYGPIEPNGKRFAGRVAVITGAENSSATGVFANLFKTNRLGPLVGQETGRNRRGGNGDRFFFATLPGSKLEWIFPSLQRRHWATRPMLEMRPIQ